MEFVPIGMEINSISGVENRCKLRNGSRRSFLPFHSMENFGLYKVVTLVIERAGRQGFLHVVQAVGGKWENIAYKVFDAPHQPGNYSKRVKFLRNFGTGQFGSHVQVLESTICRNKEHLMSILEGKQRKSVFLTK